MDYLTGKAPVPGRITPLIDGLEYFNELFTQIDALQAGDKLYLMNWAIDWKFVHKPTMAAPIDLHRDALLTKLQAKVADGVDVRVMIWVNTNLFDPLYPITPHFIYSDNSPGDSGTPSVQQSMQFGDVMAGNIITVHKWRNVSVDDVENAALENRIIINTLDSLTGGCHAKFAVIHKSTPSDEYVGIGYTGGMDLANSRYSEQPHSWSSYWHDAMAKIEGSEIVEALYGFYKEVWNENVNRKADFNPVIFLKKDTFPDLDLADDISVRCIPDGAEPIGLDEDGPVQFDPSVQPSDHLVQSLRTIPDIYPIFGEPELSFAPDGIFEFRDSLLHAFEKAERYIYVEDQAQNSLELFSALHTALQRSHELKVLLAIGEPDPADAERSADMKVVNSLRYSKFTPDEKSRFHFFGLSYVVHSKVYIVDDEVAIIGSAGFMTRSLTTELEHAVAFIDVNGNSSIKALRDRLWQEHTGIDSSAMALDDAIATWETALGEPGANRRIKLEERLFTDLSGIRNELPSVVAKQASGSTLTATEQEHWDALNAFQTEMIEAVVTYYLPYEAPYYASWLHSSASSPTFGCPVVPKKEIAIYEKASIKLFGSETSNTVWQYDGADATPASGTGEQFEVAFSTAGTKTVIAVQQHTPSAGPLTHAISLTVVENSGPHWCDRFPPKTEVDELKEPFLSNVRNFLDAVEVAGLVPTIHSTYSPPERAYLMATAFGISKGADPQKIKEKHPNVRISWVHLDAGGQPDLVVSRQAAADMVAAYDIDIADAVYPSKHSHGAAIDMEIAVTNPVWIKNKSKRTIRIKTQQQLTAVARTYGVIRQGSSNHWSLSQH
jgi:phosphatidylserine/phosphatidylglycerophosphate/cardiolipin synthase-like enzyme